MAVRIVCPAAVALVKKFEGIPRGEGSDDSVGIVRPYLDPVGIWTIGWGHAITSQGRFLRGDADRAQALALYPNGLTLSAASALLASDLDSAGRDVTLLVYVALSDNQFGALTSFTFNLGAGNLRASTLLKKLNAGDYAGAADEFPRWAKAGGQTLPGLLARRNAEQALFLTPDAALADADKTAAAPSHAAVNTPANASSNATAAVTESNPT